MNTTVNNGRFTIWLILLQEFNITISDKPRKDNVVVDFLSILTISDDDTAIEESFPDEYLFSIKNRIAAWLVCTIT